MIHFNNFVIHQMKILFEERLDLRDSIINQYVIFFFVVEVE